MTLTAVRNACCNLTPNEDGSCPSHGVYTDGSYETWRAWNDNRPQATCYWKRCQEAATSKVQSWDYPERDGLYCSKHSYFAMKGIGFGGQAVHRGSMASWPVAPRIAGQREAIEALLRRHIEESYEPAAFGPMGERADRTADGRRLP